MTWTLLHGDCREVLATMEDASVDAVVTDPPYELGFMGKAWDAAGVAYSVDLWAEVLRVLKPGGHLLAFGGTRTYHRMTVAIEDAGFEVRDSIHWVYGSGFPKSLDVSKAIDKAAGAEREVVGTDGRSANESWLGTAKRGETGFGIGEWNLTAPATPEAATWEGWGTALKPAHEPIVVARKPLAGTVATTVLQYGTGALNIDRCRIGMGDEYDPDKVQRQQRADGPVQFGAAGLIGSEIPTYNPSGRWPANFVLTHAADCGDDCAPGCPVAAMDEQSGQLCVNKPAVHRRDAATAEGRRNASSFRVGAAESGSVRSGFGDAGGASRFFTVTEWDDAPFRYVAKPSRAERNAGLGGLPEVHRVNGNKWTDQDYRVARGERPESAETGPRRNIHPTVKPLDLMRWLVRLVTPPGGVVLDPFAGSGTTLAAAILEGFDCVGVEMTDDYLPIIEGRCAWAEKAARFGPVTGRPRVDGDDTPTLFDVEDDK
jgi:site-specific DNA-methyltransferase (adenine-specific)